jgi:hypothetical protein
MPTLRTWSSIAIASPSCRERFSQTNPKDGEPVFGKNATQMNSRLIRALCFLSLLLGLLLLLGSPKIAVAVPRHVVQMGDPDDTNEKPSSGPGIRDNTTAHAHVRPTKVSTVHAPGSATRERSTLELALIYLRLVATGEVR